jgi:glucosamine--fructose-6-phosphate aminotransferase (isomerizing)
VASGATAAIEKGNYRHFMQKEIFEQPIVVAQTLRSYLRRVEETVSLPQIDFDLASINRVTIVACGTSYYAGMVAKYWFEQFARLPVDIDVASEFRYRDPVLEPGGLALFISQAARPPIPWPRCAIARPPGRPLPWWSTCRPARWRARPTCCCPPTRAGNRRGLDQGVHLPAGRSGRAGRPSGGQARAPLGREEATIVEQLAEAPAALNAALAHDEEIAAMAPLIAPARDVLYLGRGPDYPLALEGALKLKEISYIHAEGYASGEMKHGPIALIDEAVPVIVLAPSGRCSRRPSPTCRKCARGGKIVLISTPKGWPRRARVPRHHRDAQGSPADRAAGLCRAGAIAGLSRGRRQGHRCRPAAQSGQERHGRVIRIRKRRAPGLRARRFRFLGAWSETVVSIRL